MHVAKPGTLWMVNCVIRNNEVLDWEPSAMGGGVYVNSAIISTAGGTSPCEYTVNLREVFMQNCLVSCNKAVDGGGLFFFNSYTKAEIVNCTFTGNVATTQGGGITALGSCVKVHNSILWDNTAPTGPELVATLGSDLTVSYSILQGGCDAIEQGSAFSVACNEEPNVLDEGPLFVDPPVDPQGCLPFGPCSSDVDLHIRGNSPAIDAGDNTKILDDIADLDNDENTAEPTPLDLDLNPRIVNGVVDMGAYEFQCASASPPEQPDPADEAVSAKNRYISVKAGDPGRSQAIRVTFVSLPPPFDVWNCMQFFVGQPHEACENSGKGLETDPLDCPAALPTDRFWAAPLECHNVSVPGDPPLFMDWHGRCYRGLCVGGLEPEAECSVDDDCQKVIHLYSEGIIPSKYLGDPAIYDIQAIDETCSLEDESNYSAPLTMTQARWGDICGGTSSAPCTGAADGVVDVTHDVLGVLDKFANVNNLQKTRADIEPGDFEDNNGPDFKVQVAKDVILTLDAFLGDSYPFTPDPNGPCPAE